MMKMGSQSRTGDSGEALRGAAKTAIRMLVGGCHLGVANERGTGKVWRAVAAIVLAIASLAAGPAALPVKAQTSQAELHVWPLYFRHSSTASYPDKTDDGNYIVREDLTAAVADGITQAFCAENFDAGQISFRVTLSGTAILNADYRIHANDIGPDEFNTASSTSVNYTLSGEPDRRECVSFTVLIRDDEIDEQFNRGIRGFDEDDLDTIVISVVNLTGAVLRQGTDSFGLTRIGQLDRTTIRIEDEDRDSGVYFIIDQDETTLPSILSENLSSRESGTGDSRYSTEKQIMVQALNSPRTGFSDLEIRFSGTAVLGVDYDVKAFRRAIFARRHQNNIVQAARNRPWIEWDFGGGGFSRRTLYIRIVVKEDREMEGTETIVIDIDPGRLELEGRAAPRRYTVRLFDNDRPAPAAEAGVAIRGPEQFKEDLNSWERGAPENFHSSNTVTLSISRQEVDLSLSLTVDGTATKCGDYLVSGRITGNRPDRDGLFAGDRADTGQCDGSATTASFIIRAGETSFRFLVKAIDDSLDEERHETVVINLGRNTQGREVTLSINLLDNDPWPRIRITSPTVEEVDTGGTSVLRFEVSKTGLTTLFTSVGYEITSTGTATLTGAGKDITHTVVSPLIFAPEETLKTIEVTVDGDDLVEGDETVVIRLSSPVNVDLPDGAARIGTGTIVDNDRLEISISDSSAAESDTGQTTSMAFEVALGAQTPADLSVAYEVTGGTAEGEATEGVDFTAAFGRLTFRPGGSLTQRFTVSIIGDDLLEQHETFTVTLSNPQCGGCPSNISASLKSGESTATGIILDNESVHIQISSPAINEGNARESTMLSFNVSLSTTRNHMVTVDYSLAPGGTADSGVDFVAFTGGTLTFDHRQNETSKTVTVTVIGDAVYENDETVLIALSNPTGGTVLAGVTSMLIGTGTITNDDDAPLLAISSPGENEGNEGDTAILRYEISKTGFTALPATVAYSIGGTGTATLVGSDMDFAHTVNSPISFTAAETLKVIEIAIVGDSVTENDETVVVTLSSPDNAKFANDSPTIEGTGTIRNDDEAPLLEFGPLPTVTEGDAGGTTTMRFDVTKEGATALPIAVTYVISGTASSSGAEADYTHTGVSFSIPANQNSTFIDIDISGDDLAEANETVIITLSNPVNARFANQAATIDAVGTIINDDFMHVTINAPEVVEGAAGSTTTLTFSANLAARSPQFATVEYEVIATGPRSGTAVHGPGLSDDYTATALTGTLTFTAGIAAPQTQTFSVTVRGDDSREPNETVVVRLHSLSSNAEFPGGSSVTEILGTGTIINDDDPSFTVDPARTIEGAENEETRLIFTVTMSPAWHEVVTVDFDVTGGTAAGAATIDEDFRGTSGTLTYAPGTGGATGETVKTITVTVLGDDADEEDEEEVTLTFSNVSPNASIQRAVWTGVIVDDDDSPVFSIDSPRVDEGDIGNASLVFTVSRLGDTRRDTSVTFTVGEGTAEVGEGGSSDYLPTARGQLEFMPSESSMTVEVQVRGDNVVEADETLTVTLSNPVLSTLDPNGTIGTGIIANDDQLAFSVSSPEARELDEAQTSTLTFVVTLSATVPADVTVDFDVEGETAIEGVDFETVMSNTLTFVEGDDLTQSIDVTVNGDLLPEGLETLKATLSSATCELCPAGISPTIEADTGIGRIIDNEAVLVSINAPSVLEGNPGDFPTLNFEVTLDSEWSEDVTVSYSFGGGTAVSDSLAINSPPDFEAFAGGTLTFDHAQNEVSKTIRVRVIGDALAEDNEVVVVALKNLKGSAIFAGGDSSLMSNGIIENDDYGLSIGNPNTSVTEPGAASETALLEFPVTLEPAASDSVSVRYSFGGTATEGADYRDATVTDGEDGVLVFLQGETSKNVVARINSDFVAERIETVTVSLSVPTGAYVDSELTTAIGTIRPIPNAATLSVESPGVAAGGDGPPLVSFGLRLSAMQSSDVAVDWVLSEVIVQEAIGQQLADARSSSVAPRNVSTRSLAVGSAVVEASSATAAVEGDFNAGITLAGIQGQLVIELARPGGAEIEVNQTSDIAGDVQAAIHESGRAAAVVFDIGESRSRPADIAVTGVLSAFGRSVAIDLVETIWNRAEAHRYRQLANRVRLGGRFVNVDAFSSGTDARRAAREAARVVGVDAVAPATLSGAESDDEIITGGNLDDFKSWAGIPDSEGIARGSSFTLAVGEGSNGWRSVVYWGTSSSGDFESKLGGGGSSSLSTAGSRRSINFGFDIPQTESTLLGFVISSVSGNSNYHFANPTAESGWVNASLTSATPWLRWKSPAGLEIWGAYGIGWGDAQSAHEGQSMNMDLSARTFAFGAWNQVGTYGSSGIAAKADVFMASVSTEGASAAVDSAGADSRRIRLAAEMGPDLSSSAGQRMSYTVELGARHDSGDAASGIGMDTAAGFHYVSPSGSIQLSGRGSFLLFHGQDGLSESGLGLGLSYDPGADIRGIQLSLEPTWNTPRSNAADSMWYADSSSDLTVSSDEGAMVKARIGYGIGAVRERALATLYGEAGAGSADRRLRLGAELRGLDRALELLSIDLYGERDESQSLPPEHAVFLEGRVGF